MPYVRRQSRRKAYRRRRNRKTKSRRSYQTNGLTRNVGLNPFPPRLTCKLKYSSGALAFTNATTLASHQFGSNNIYDPDTTGIGHQPYWRDQVATLYTRYRVTHVNVKIIGKQLTADIPGFVALSAVPTGKTLGTTLSALVEQRQKHKITKQDQNIVMSKSWRIRDIDSLTSTKFDGIIGYTANVGQPPAYVPQIYLTVASFDEFTNCSFTFRAELTYTVEYYDLVSTAQS